MLTTFRYFLLTIFASLNFLTFSQSVHQTDLEFYNSTGIIEANEYESLPNTQLISSQRENCTLQKTVYGWHPYWGGSSYLNYQWDLLSHLSFFSYEVDYLTGNAITTHGWSSSEAVDAALASGNTKVTLCVTLFSNHSSFLTNATSKQTLITNLINLVNSRGAHGVNIDFEGLPTAQKTNFANFMVSLANQMHVAIPNSEVSTVLYAVDWNSVFDFSIMEPAVDQYIIMGYDYYYSGSSSAGPNDPLYHFGSNYNYTLSKSVTYYLDIGCPKSKLILGLPYYGRDWPTVSGAVPTSTTGTGSSKTFAVVKNNTSGFYSPANNQYNNESFSDIYSYLDVTNRQCHITEEDGFDARLKHVLRTGIGGIGIWALGYDNGYSQLWDAIESNLTDCQVDNCSGEIFDFGGPMKNYYNNEDYTWTISPENAATISVDFSEFFIELNYDYLYIYDGNSTLSPQIVGSPFTGTNSPGSFTSSTGAVTFRFTSDGATVDPGFLASYSCNMVSAPVANFEVPLTTICEGDSILLSNTSQNATSYEWTVNEGELSSTTEMHPYFFPSSSGNYTIELSATNAQGTETYSNSFSIVVIEAPVAGANVNPSELVAPNAIAFFTNTSTNATSYSWDFGDGSTSTDSNPWNEYTSSGSYTVQLIASSEGCESDTFFIEIIVGMLNLETMEAIGVSIHPNPFNDYLIIDGQQLQNAELYDLSGKLIFSKDLNCTSCVIQELNHVTAGMYVLVVNRDSNYTQFKLIKE